MGSDQSKRLAKETGLHPSIVGTAIRSFESLPPLVGVRQSDRDTDPTLDRDAWFALLLAASPHVSTLLEQGDGCANEGSVPLSLSLSSLLSLYGDVGGDDVSRLRERHVAVVSHPVWTAGGGETRGGGVEGWWVREYEGGLDSLQTVLGIERGTGRRAGAGQVDDRVAGTEGDAAAPEAVSSDDVAVGSIHLAVVLLFGALCCGHLSLADFRRTFGKVTKVGEARHADRDATTANDRRRRSANQSATPASPTSPAKLVISSFTEQAGVSGDIAERYDRLVRSQFGERRSVSQNEFRKMCEEVPGVLLPMVLLGTIVARVLEREGGTQQPQGGGGALASLGLSLSSSPAAALTSTVCSLSDGSITSTSCAARERERERDRTRNRTRM